MTSSWRTRRWRTLLDRAAGPAPAWPAAVDRAAEAWHGAPVRLRLLAVVVGLLAAGAAVGARGEPSVTTVVAGRDLAAGTTLAVTDLAVRQLPRSLIPDDAVTSTDALEARVLRHPVAAGQPILGRSVVTGIDAMLRAGHAAIALPSDLVPELVGGQRVDIVGSAADGTSRILAADARVLQLAADVVWVEVEREATAPIGHALAWGGLTIAVLPAG